ncbi:unnamed protein product [Ascophyllum nodosum]
MTQGYWRGGLEDMWHGDKEVASGPGPFLVVSRYTIWTPWFQPSTPPVPHGPQGSSVQAESGASRAR